MAPRTHRIRDARDGACCPFAVPTFKRKKNSLTKMLRTNRLLRGSDLGGAWEGGEQPHTLDHACFAAWGLGFGVWDLGFRVF